MQQKLCSLDSRDTLDKVSLGILPSRICSSVLSFILILLLLLVVLLKGAFYYKSNNVVTSRRVVSVRAEVTTTDTPPVKKVGKESKKNEEGVITNKYRPKEPYTGKVLLNTKITADDAPGETWHMVFSHQGFFAFAFS